MAGYENPFIRGLMGARQQNQETALNELRATQGLLGIQGAQQKLQESQQTQQLKGLLGQKLQSGDMEGAKGILMQMKPELFAANLVPKPQEAFTLAPGATRFGPDGKPIASAPVENKIAPNGQVYNPREIQPGQSFQDPNRAFSMSPNGPVPNLPFQRFELDKAARSAAKNTMVVNPALDPFKNEKALRDEYRQNPVVKNADEMAGAFRLIDTAYKNPSPANDLAMATKYMKILDPTSVVRESELALALGAVGILDKVYNYANLIASGQKLTPTQRKDFYDSASAINAEFQKGKSAVSGQYSRIANRYGLKPGNVTLENSAGTSITEQADAILNGK